MAKLCVQCFKNVINAICLQACPFNLMLTLLNVKWSISTMFGSKIWLRVYCANMVLEYTTVRKIRRYVKQGAYSAVI